MLRDKHVIAVAGTHGKTTTTAMLTWILEHAGLAPGFLIGGVPSNFDSTARLGKAPFFVIEADEYDTAFFDKRAKFVHYRPRTAILNNLEYDHADIYPDVASIRRQFNQLLRTVPGAGRIIVNGEDAELARTLSMGCWTPRETFVGAGGARRGAEALAIGARISRQDRRRAASRCILQGRAVAEVDWPLLGEHNVMNALAAIAAARHVGVDAGARRAGAGRFAASSAAWKSAASSARSRCMTISRITRRPSRRPCADCARGSGRTHRRRAGAALEHHEAGRASRAIGAGACAGGPDLVLESAGSGLGFAGGRGAPWATRARFAANVDALVEGLADDSRPGDHILVMSNGGFGGLHEKLLAALRARTARGVTGGVNSIALFPLNIVLFPAGPLPLRIFETRYVDMVRRCMREAQAFGVVLIREGREVGPAETFDVGTVAKIIDFHQLSDGLLGLSCVGRAALSHSRAAAARPTGSIWPKSSGCRAEPVIAVPARHARLAELLEKRPAAAGRGVRRTSRCSLDDAAWVGHRLAEILPIPLADKQGCLELDDPIERLDVLEPLA